MKETKKETLAMDVIRQAKRQAKIWFTAWLITMVSLIFTNIGWIIFII